MIEQPSSWTLVKGIMHFLDYVYQKTTGIKLVFIWYQQGIRKSMFYIPAKLFRKFWYPALIFHNNVDF